MSNTNRWTSDVEIVRSEEEKNNPVTETKSASAWADPRLWVSLLGVLLGLGVTILSYISTQLSTINGAVQGIVISTTRQGTEIESLKERVAKAEADAKALETAFRDYAYNINGRIGQLEAIEKMRSSERKP